MPSSEDPTERESISAGHGWAAFYRQLHEVQIHADGAQRTGRVTARRWRVDPIAPERRARDLADREHTKPLALSDLAAAAGLSRHHLVRRFAAAYGQTPMRYLAMRRLERAGAMLRTSELPVIEICLAVGYRSLGSFGRAFLSRFGTSPADYRRRAGGAIRVPAGPSRVPAEPSRVPACFLFMAGVGDRATSE